MRNEVNMNYLNNALDRIKETVWRLRHYNHCLPDRGLIIKGTPLKLKVRTICGDKKGDIVYALDDIGLSVPEQEVRWVNEEGKQGYSLRKDVSIAKSKPPKSFRDIEFEEIEKEIALAVNANKTLHWHPFDGSVEPTANKRYLVMHYDNAPQDKTTLEHDYEFSVMICEQVQTGEKLFACICKGEFIEPSEHVYFAEFPNLPTHITED